MPGLLGYMIAIVVTLDGYLAGFRSSIHSDFDRDANEVGMVFGAKLLFQQRRCIGDRLVGDFEGVGYFGNLVSPRQKPQYFEFPRRHLRSRTGPDSCRRKCYGFGKMRRDELFARGYPLDCFHKQARVVAF